MSKTQKLDIFINFKTTGNNPNKAHNEFIKKVIRLLISEQETLKEKGYVLEVDMYHRKLER